MSNNQDGHRVSALAEMAAFDRLPARIRQALTEAPFNYDARQVLVSYEQYRRNYGGSDNEFLRAFSRTVARDLAQG